MAAFGNQLSGMLDSVEGKSRSAIEGKQRLILHKVFNKGAQRKFRDPTELVQKAKGGG